MLRLMLNTWPLRKPQLRSYVSTIIAMVIVNLRPLPCSSRIGTGTWWYLHKLRNQLICVHDIGLDCFSSFPLDRSASLTTDKYPTLSRSVVYQWSSWSSWSSCSRTCDGGIMTRHRSCRREYARSDLINGSLSSREISVFEMPPNWIFHLASRPWQFFNSKRTYNDYRPFDPTG